MLTLNAQRLLRSLIVDGPTFRADLARTLKVTRATISNITTQLGSEGWIEELEHEPGSLKSLIGTSPHLRVLVSVMFLVDSCTVMLARLDGRQLSKTTQVLSPERDPQERLTFGADLVSQQLAAGGLKSGALSALHLSVDTQIDAQSGHIHAQQASIRWFGVNPKDYFSQRFGVPIYIQNSARLEGLAEYLWAIPSAHENLLYLDVSYGITSSWIDNGVIQSGARGGSGELGHTIYDWNGPLCTCGNTGCLMQYVSIRALLANYATLTGVTLTWTEFSALIQTHDSTAIAIGRRAATILGRALINTCHLLDPEIVVLGGTVARDIPFFTETVQRVVVANTLPLVSKNIQFATARLKDTHTATAHAGIESLRKIPEVVVAAANPSTPALQKDLP